MYFEQKIMEMLPKIGLKCSKMISLGQNFKEEIEKWFWLIINLFWIWILFNYFYRPWNFVWLLFLRFFLSWKISKIIDYFLRVNILIRLSRTPFNSQPLWWGFWYIYQSCPTASSEIWACEISLIWNVLEIKLILKSLAF